MVGRIVSALHVLYLRLSGVKIGPNTTVSLSVKIDSHAGSVEIGSNCHLGHGCVILSHDGAAKQIYQLDNSSSKVIGKIVIEDDVYIEPKSIILNNVRIGRGSVVNAGSVVNRDVPPYSIVSGNPAQIMGRTASMPPRQ
jgi:acetyltransferase-like isoleucine patch superfamily enzyme